MRKNKGFTLIELMIVIAIIAIIAAIAIPNLIQSRIRANEATAVTVIKAYATAQVTFQVGKFGNYGGNTAAGKTGYASNYRNLFYGYAPGTTAGTSSTPVNQNPIQLISQAHADAYASNADDGDVTAKTLGTPGAQAAYQGYFFLTPTGIANRASYFDGNFSQLAFPSNSVSTGTTAYWVGLEGTVRAKGLTAGPTNSGLNVAELVTDLGSAAKTPTGLSVADATKEGWNF